MTTGGASAVSPLPEFMLTAGESALTSEAPTRRDHGRHRYDAYASAPETRDGASQEQTRVPRPPISGIPPNGGARARS